MPPKKAEGERSPEWNFDPRDVKFKVSIRATFHPAIKDAVVSVQWLGLNGQAPQTISFSPLGTLEVDTSARPSMTSPKPGHINVYAEKDLGTVSLGVAFVESLRSAKMPISIKLKPDGAEQKKTAPLHLGPLLLSGGSSQELGTRSLEESLKRTTRFLGNSVLTSCADDLAVVGLHHLEVQVFTDIPVLSKPMLEQLLPACFTVEAVRSLPNESWLKGSCEDVFLEIYPKLSSTTVSIDKACPRVRSGSRPHNALIRFYEPVVWFLGQAPLHAVRDWLQHEGVVVEVHDRDIKKPPAPPPETSDEGDAGGAPISPHGIASFSLAPLLEPIALEVGLSSDVFPARGDKKKRRAEAIQSDALSAEGLLDEEGRAKIARKMAAGLDKREDTVGYHGIGTVCSVRVALALPVPQAKAIQNREEESQLQQWAAEETIQQNSNVWKGPLARNTQVPGQPPRSPRSSPYRVKMPIPTGDAKVPFSASEQIVGPWRRTLADAQADERLLLAAADAAKAAASAAAAAAAPPEPKAKSSPAKVVEVDPVTLAKAVTQAMSAAATDLVKNTDERGSFDRRYERYSRLIYFAEETDLHAVQAILHTIKHHNASVLRVDPESTALLMYELSKEERADPHLDLLTGFAVLDSNAARVIVIEGLRDKPGVQQLLKAAPRGLEQWDQEAMDARSVSTSPSRRRHRTTQPMRLLHNPTIGFAERLYLDFGPRLKQIKIRVPLERLATRSDLYIWSEAQTKETLSAAEAPKRLVGLKQTTRVGFLRSAAPFPEPEQLLNLEMLYGGYVTDEELAGFPPPRTSSKGSLTATTKPASRGARSKAEFLAQAVTEESLGALAEGSHRPVAERRAPVSMENAAYEETLALRRSVSVPNFINTNKEVVKQKSDEVSKRNEESGKKRPREGPFQEGQQVFNYSSQKLNSTEIQKAWMREKMDPQQKTKMWTYNEAYSSQSFDFSGAAPPGKRQHEPSCPNNSYANLPCDNRQAFRAVQARSPEELNKLDRDVGPARSDELKLAFVENEWHMLPMGDGRHRPIATHVSFDLEKTPHIRRTVEQPFHPAMAKPNPLENFGNPTDFESVHYHGREPGESRGAEAEMHNLKERAAQAAFLGARTVKIFSQGCTRNSVTTLDRCEQMLKDPPALQLRGDIDKQHPSSMRIYEPYHDVGRPDKEWHARLRENDGSPPLDVMTGAHLRRDPQVGAKLGCMSGTLGKAPWSHGSNGATMVKAASLTGRGLATTHCYPSAKDFDRTKPPKPEKLQIAKNASRIPISAAERSSSLQYLRPSHYGVELSA